MLGSPVRYLSPKTTSNVNLEPRRQKQPQSANTTDFWIDDQALDDYLKTSSFSQNTDSCLPSGQGSPDGPRSSSPAPFIEIDFQSQYDRIDELMAEHFP